LGDRVAPHALNEGRLLVAVPRPSTGRVDAAVRFEIRAAGAVVQRLATSFLGPQP
jgi:hypothetical protein